MRSALTLVLALALAACDRTEPTDPDGSYALASVAGQSLPFTVIAGLQFVVRSGTLVLDQGGRFSFRQCNGDQQPKPYSGCTFEEVDAGTWRVAGTSLELTGDAGSARTLTVAGPELREFRTDGALAGFATSYRRAR